MQIFHISDCKHFGFNISEIQKMFSLILLSHPTPGKKRLLQTLLPSQLSSPNPPEVAWEGLVLAFSEASENCMGMLTWLGGGEVETIQEQDLLVQLPKFLEGLACHQKWHGMCLWHTCHRFTITALDIWIFSYHIPRRKLLSGLYMNFRTVVFFIFSFSFTFGEKLKCVRCQN